MSHAGHQVTQAGTRLSSQCIAGVPQVVEMEVRDPDLLTGLSPADCGIEVSAMPRLPVLVDKYQPVRAIERERERERVGVQWCCSSGRMAAGKETMRIPPLISVVLVEGRRAW